MSGILYNLYQNAVLSWKYGDNQIPEPEEWKSEKIGIFLLNEKKLSNSSSYFFRFQSVVQRIFSMACNSLLLYRYGCFDLTEKALVFKKGNYKSICYFPTFITNMVFITNPNIIRSILMHERNETGERAFFSGGIPTEIAKRILGDNLLSYSDVEHALIRKVISSHLTHVKKFDNLLFQLIKPKIEKWQTNDSVVISSILPTMIVEAVCRCYLQYDGPFQQITKAIEILLSHVEKNENYEYENALDFLEKCAMEVEDKGLDFNLFKDIREDQLRAFIKLMFFAGQDTTSSLIEYLVLSLGQDDMRVYQDSIYEQWVSSKLTVVDFAQRSSDLECIIKEGLRLHPPSFEQTRRAVQGLVFDNNFIVPEGAELHLHHLFSQRDIRRWGADALSFNPKRHLRNIDAKQATYSFSTGPTGCLGRQFATMLVKIFLMTLIVELRWFSISKMEKLSGHIALTIEPAVKIHIEKREKIL